MRVQLVKSSRRRSLLTQHNNLQSSFKGVSSAGTNLVQQVQKRDHVRTKVKGSERTRLIKDMNVFQEISCFSQDE